MRQSNPHLQDDELLLAIDGELPPSRAAEVQSHLGSCWPCRVRRQELETTIADFVRLHEKECPDIPSADGPRALLRARMANAGAQRHAFAWRRLGNWLGTPVRSAAGVLAVVVIALTMSRFMSPERSGAATVAFPKRDLTPGAVLTLGRQEVCFAGGSNNRAVPASLRRRVLEEYGIPEAAHQLYEIDYLITPALGGADDIHNLWPQSYEATAWNAHVKDELEDRLRQMVCDGSLDLATAQREIAEDWIAAYKKYVNAEIPGERAK